LQLGKNGIVKSSVCRSHYVIGSWMSCSYENNHQCRTYRPIKLQWHHNWRAI